MCKEGGESIWVSKSEKPREKGGREEERGGVSEREVALPSCLGRKLLWC